MELEEGRDGITMEQGRGMGDACWIQLTHLWRQGQDLINAFTFQSGQADNSGTAMYNGLSDAWNKGL